MELHLHAAEVDESSPGLQLDGAGSRGAGPLFMTADLPGCSTAMTPVVQGGCFTRRGLHCLLGGEPCRQLWQALGHTGAN